MLKKFISTSIFALLFIVFIVSPVKAQSNTNDAINSSSIFSMPGQSYFQNPSAVSQSSGSLSTSPVSNLLQQAPSSGISVDSPVSTGSQVTNNNTSSDAWIIVLISVLALTSFGYMITDTSKFENSLNDEDIFEQEDNVTEITPEDQPEIVEEIIVEETLIEEIPKKSTKKETKKKRNKHGRPAKKKRK